MLPPVEDSDPSSDQKFDAPSEFSAQDQSERAVIFANKYLSLNEPERAILAYEKALRYDQTNVVARLELSKVFANCGLITEALQQIHEVFRDNPTMEKCVETTRTILQWNPGSLSFSGRLNDTPPRPLVTMSLLGHDGRFGNQVYQYAFLRLYTAIHGFDYETPPWIGQALFGHKDPPLSSMLPLRMCTEGGLVPFHRATGYESASIPCNVDLQGYFQYHTSVYRPFREQFLALFKPIPPVSSMLHEWVAEIKRDCETLVVIHLRFGDQEGTEFESDGEACAQWLAENWDNWRNPRLVVLSDNPARANRAFSQFVPYHTPPIVLPIPGAEFYPDYFLMTQADVLIISRSTFSFTASLLNSCDARFYRPTTDKASIVPFAPWDTRF
jgi:hypothetical protein